jgi:hypothetical protein
MFSGREQKPPVNPRDKICKAMKQLENEFIQNCSFEFYTDHRELLRSMTFLESRLSVAMQLYANKRVHYQHFGMNYSQQPFLRKPPSWREDYETMVDQFTDYFDEMRDEFLDRAMKLRESYAISGEKFDFGDFLLLFHVEIGEGMKVMDKEKSELQERLNACDVYVSVGQQGSPEPEAGTCDESQETEDNDSNESSVEASEL